MQFLTERISLPAGPLKKWEGAAFNYQRGLCVAIPGHLGNQPERFCPPCLPNTMASH